ncbi:GNAT family N-acetyltransferase [Glutamicibacter arilaitensis]|uniref:GNAT family N-acetyltransferase n=1 Tax=Glutamicibacter arilaitensis TaxID=256701 RepID=UPI003A93398F
MHHINISDYRNDPAVRQLLVLAAEPANEQELEALLDECENLQVLVHAAATGQIVALAAYRHSDKYALCIEYLAVDGSHEHQGLGRALLVELRERQKKILWATTAADAVGFYRAIGCVVSASSTDPRWPDAARFLCTLPYFPLLNSQPEEDPEYEAVGGELMRGLIEIAEPSPHWVQDFQALHACISQALGSTALAIEHTGSTSVPGLPAKPIIDVILLVPDASQENAYVPALESAGLILWHRETGWYGHRMFKTAANSGLADANIHVFSAGSPEYLRHLIFREHLKQNDADRTAYAAIKREAARALAAAEGANGLVMDYNRIKEPFIRSVHDRIFAG